MDRHFVFEASKDMHLGLQGHDSERLVNLWSNLNANCDIKRISISKGHAQKHSSPKATQKIAELKDQKIKRLQAKLADKNEVIAELMEEKVGA